MSGIVRPFKAKPRDPSDASSLASVGIVARMIQQELSKLNVTADGADLSAQDEGNVHIKVNGGSDASATAGFPFQITAAGNGININTGSITVDGSGMLYPTVNGVSLQAGPLALSLGAATWHVVLAISLTPVFGTVNVGSGNEIPVTYITGASVLQNTCSILAYINPPPDEPCQIDYTAGIGQPGTFYVRLAQVAVNGQGGVIVLTQDWRSNIACAMQGDGNLFLAAK